MDTVGKLKKFEWTKNWEGSFTILSAMSSIGAGVYNKEMMKCFGVNIPHALVIHREGITSCYLVDRELSAFGDGLFSLIKENPKRVSTWCEIVRKGTDEIARLVKKPAKEIMQPNEFKKFADLKRKISCYQIGLKQVIDNLDEKSFKAYNSSIEQPRRYSEKVYFEIEKILDTLLVVIEKKSGISKKWLSSLSPEEMIFYLETGKLPQAKLLKKRYHFSAILYSDKTESLSEEEWREIEKHWINQTKRLIGKTAYPGKVKGVCRIVVDFKNALFKEGEILVTGMTDPNFVPMMKKSIAIITDAGGILSHAAIVSRELKIPCIIGTKHATRILKNGDVVMVDANKGIVTTLKRI